MPEYAPVDYTELHFTEDNPNASDLMPIGRIRGRRRQETLAVHMPQNFVHAIGEKVMAGIDRVFDVRGRGSES